MYKIKRKLFVTLLSTAGNVKELRFSESVDVAKAIGRSYDRERKIVHIFTQVHVDEPYNFN